MRIDQLNIALILLSLATAFLLPFHLFLFAYAVLGPLHYLTEIAWLKKHQYFMKGKNDHFPLLILAFLIFVNIYFFSTAGSFGPALVYIAFLGTLALITFKNIQHRLAALFAITISSFFFREFSYFGIFFGILLTTIIHVFIFTAAFMLYGALKSKSKWGFLGFGILIISSVICLLPIPIEGYVSLNDYMKQSYSDFQSVNQTLMNLFQWNGNLFSSPAGIAVMRFIAFVYTYHYLNWFSKTSIIGWYEASKKHRLFIGATWLLSIGIYAYDYRLGLACLYFLSLVHVFLEFPLNIHTFKGIAKELSPSRI